MTRRQRSKLRNAKVKKLSKALKCLKSFNMQNKNSKLSKAQSSEIIQSGRFLGSLLSKLAGQLMKVVVALAKKIFELH